MPLSPIRTGKPNKQTQIKLWSYYCVCSNAQGYTPLIGKLGGERDRADNNNNNKVCQKMFYFLDIVGMHIGCASFTICFFLIQSSLCADLFPATSYGFLQSSLEILQSLKNGSQVKISKNLEFSGLPKTKQISLSPVGTFHISTKSQPPFTLTPFFL